MIKKYQGQIRTAIALLLVMIPIAFVWHTELIFMGIESFTNGFFTFDIAQTYHTWMYAMFIINFIGAYFILRGRRDREC